MKLTLKEVAEKLNSAEKILVTAHVSPDGDALGSTLAMCQALRQFGKSAQIFIDDKLPPYLNFLPHIDEIKRPQEGEKFDADLILLLDTVMDRTGNIRSLTDAPILNVDHHITNTETENDLYLEPNAAATCEIVFALLKEMGAEFTKEIATCIYTGIATDTGFFKYRSTTPKTLRAAAELLECGVEPNYISEQVERRTLNDFMVIKRSLQTTEMFFDGKVAGIFIDAELSKIVDTTEGIIDLIRVIDSVEIAFVLTYKEENLTKLSLRSKTVDVAAVAKKLGGGGHIRAAGCTFHTSLDESKEMLLKTLSEYL